MELGAPGEHCKLLTNKEREIKLWKKKRSLK